MNKKAAVIPGDGIGPEVVGAMLEVLRSCNTGIEIIECEAGSEQWERNGRRDSTYIPEATSQVLGECGACFKGPTTTIPEPGAPRSVAVTLRQRFELYANVRPVRTYERITPGRDLDFVCFREATEGLYAGVESDVGPGAAIAIRKVTRRGCDRLLDAAARWAVERGMSRMVAITKRNILKKTDGIFWESARRAAGAAGLGVDEIYIDNMAQQMVLRPEQFNGAVLASTNLFMDIISELASGLAGSIGLIYSANIGDAFAMFEAAHGSAPDIAGKGAANPAAAILSGAWMAGHLGEPDVRDAIFSAAEQVINGGGAVTADIGGSATTSQMSAAIAGAAAASLRR
ncbi:MAG: isocitrate/isopropylmalate family dehydrogenase [Nitrosopumilus sp.]|nr:isocitrate/isopropylmalate family dehydrogenase [Nitrosopumilus sp.]MDA7958647.1 isocitrate/isopropylmalate family dehydrogenase [Nitrosopumilus sp.]